MIHFWMNIPSFYQSELFRELGSRTDLRVSYAADLPAGRKALGWVADQEGFAWKKLANVTDVVRAAFMSRSDANVVNGIWAEWKFALALIIFRITRSTYFIYTEPPDPTKKRNPAVSWLLRKFFGPFILSGAAGVLAVGTSASEFVKGMGVPEDRIYPFGYFRSQALPPVGSEDHKAPHRRNLIYVGQLSLRKGVDLLLEAMQLIRKDVPDVHLSLVGTGPLEYLINDDTQKGVTNFGPMAPWDVLERITDSSALVLPSRHDGWGLVVNEAIGAGVPVVVSDACGASELVVEGRAGEVFKSGDVNDLARATTAVLRDDLYRRNAEVYRYRISLPAVVEYLLAVLSHAEDPKTPKPVAPWRSS